MCHTSGWVDALEAAGHEVVEQEHHVSYRSAYDQIALADVVVGLVNSANGTQWAVELSAAVEAASGVGEDCQYVGGAKPTFLWWGDSCEPFHFFDLLVNRGAVQLPADVEEAQTVLLAKLNGPALRDEVFYARFFAATLRSMDTAPDESHRAAEPIPTDWPAALKALYSVAGQHPANHRHNRLLAPGEAMSHESKLIFAEENQHVVVWAIDQSEVLADPRVWQGQADAAGGYRWYLEDRPLSGFMAEMWRWIRSLSS